MANQKVFVRFLGPATDNGGLPLDDVLAVLGGFQTALRHMVEHIAEGKSPRGTARDQASLTLRAVGQHPAIAEMELCSGGEPEQRAATAEAFSRLFEQAEADLPLAAAEELAWIGYALSPGIDSVTFEGIGGVGKVIVNRTDLQRKPRVPSPDAEGTLRESGRLMRLDVGTCTGELHNLFAEVLIVFDEALLPEMLRHAGDYLTVSGKPVSIQDQQERRLYVTAIEQAISDRSFWRPKSLEQLAQEQGVKPFVWDDTVVIEPEAVDQLMETIRRNREAG